MGPSQGKKKIKRKKEEEEKEMEEEKRGGQASAEVAHICVKGRYSEE